MNEEFNKWLYQVCEIKSNKLKTPHDIFPLIDLTEADVLEGAVM